MSFRAPPATAIAAALTTALAAWVSLGTLAVVDGTVRVGLLPSAWILAGLSVVGIAAVAWLRPSARTCAPLFLCLPTILPWLPTPIPDVFLLCTGPIVGFIWGATLLAMLVAVLRERQSPFALFRDRRAAPLLAAVLSFIACLAVRFAATGAPGGDEPHYLVIVQSMLNDGDLAVANNYRQMDYLPYWGGRLLPHVSSPEIAGGLYSVHAPGVPALIAPAFYAAGYWGVVACVAALVAIASAYVWKASYVFTGDAGAAWFGWATVALTAPVLLHGTLIYPDPVAGAPLAVGMYALLIARERTRDARRTAASVPSPSRRSTWIWASAGVAIGLLPWLHTRLALAAFCLGCVLLLRLAGAMRTGADGWQSAVAFFVPIVVSLSGWFAFFWTIYGTLNPQAPYGAQLPIGASYAPLGLLGLAVDQELGLLPNAPIYVLGAAAAWCIARRDFRVAIELLLIVGPYVIASSAYPMWYGGASPPARFLVPILFPAAIALAAMWASQDARGKAMSLTLLASSVFVATALAFGGDGTLAYSRELGRAGWLDWIAPLADVPRALPSFFRAGRDTILDAPAMRTHLIYPTIIWGAAAAAGWGLFRLGVGRLPDSGRARVLAASAGVLMAIALGVSAGWTAAGGDRATPTRSQLRLQDVAGGDKWIRSLGVQLPGVRTFPGAVAPSRLEIVTSPIGPAPADALLYLRDVPAGEYQLRVTRKPGGRGDLFLGIGRSTGVAWRFSPVPGRTETGTFRLPLPASSLVVNDDGDDDAIRSIERVALVPVARARDEAAPVGQLRDAMRYGQTVVFATDDRILFDPAGFSILGRRQPEVVFTTDNPANALDLELRNVAAPNRIGIRVGRWSTARELSPSEVWRVRVPVLGFGYSSVVRFEVESGAETSLGFVGCRVELR